MANIMAYIPVSDFLYKCALKIILSFDLPSTIVKVFDDFERLFEDDSNFISSDKWGEKTPSTKKKIVPFSLSDKGLERIRVLVQESPTFANIYRSGIAGIVDEKYTLLYFLTQYLSVIGSLYDYGVMRMKGEPEEKTLGLKKKMEKIKDMCTRMNTRKIYREIPDKKYTPEEAKEAKTKILNMIRSFREDFRSVGELTEEEAKYLR